MSDSQPGKTPLIASNAQRFTGTSSLFLIRRIPKRHVEREWHRPQDGEAYKTELDDEGFVVPDPAMSQALTVDLRELDQHLLPYFWRANQEARYFQNQYYQYQWGFIWSAFMTTFFAAWNVFLRAKGWEDASILGLAKYTEVLAVLMVINSAVASVVSFLQANQSPQRRWFKARAEAESLRSIYFMFLARQKPFNIVSTRDRVQMLRVKVLDIQKGNRRDLIEGSSPSDIFRLDASEHPAEDEKPDTQKDQQP